MRLAYVLPGIGMSDMEKSRREARLNEIASSDTTVVVEEVRDGPRSIENAVDEYKAMPEVLRFIRGQQEKFDGFIIGCAGDSGLEGAREQSRKPVVGPGESSILWRQAVLDDYNFRRTRPHQAAHGSRGRVE